MGPIPLFLLNAVLFPEGLMSMRVFEPRYLDMVSACLKEGCAFGIVLIHEGMEVGGPAVPEPVGTMAEIIDWDSFDGILHIRVRGRERFSIRELHYEGNLAMATVKTWVQEPPVPLPREHVPLLRVLEELAAALGPDIAERPPAQPTASQVGMRLAHALPIPAVEKQRLLNLQDPIERLRRLQQILRQPPQIPSGGTA